MLNKIPEYIDEEEIVTSKSKIIPGVIRVGISNSVIIKVYKYENNKAITIATALISDFFCESLTSVKQAWEIFKQWLKEIVGEDSRVQIVDDMIEVFDKEYWGAIYQNA